MQPVAPAKPEVAAKPLPKGDTYGPVKRGDTLPKIAKQYKPRNVTLDQMLKAYGNHPLFSPIGRLTCGQSAVNHARPRSRLEESRGSSGPFIVCKPP